MILTFFGYSVSSAESAQIYLEGSRRLETIQGNVDIDVADIEKEIRSMAKLRERQYELQAFVNCGFRK